MVPLSRGLWRRAGVSDRTLFLKTTTPEAAFLKDGASDSKPELIPFHSQLLGESLLVSFPPLNYMLKFYG